MVRCNSRALYWRRKASNAGGAFVGWAAWRTLQLHSERIVMVEWWGSIITGGPLEC